MVGKKRPGKPWMYTTEETVLVWVVEYGDIMAKEILSG